LPAACAPPKPQAAHGGALVRDGRAGLQAVQPPLASACFPGALPGAIAANELLRPGDLRALGFILFLLAAIVFGAQVEIAAVGGRIALGLPARDLDGAPGHLVEEVAVVRDHHQPTAPAREEAL